jgi:two-component system sensor histidine kinase/response regulator
MTEVTQVARPNVLMVDDVEANLVALEALLGSMSCTLVRAHSGNEGLKQLLRQDFAVILLDVQMPEMDGYEMARYARNNPATRDVPIIFLTATNETEETLLQGYGSGAVDVLFKPISAVILRSKIQVFLDLYGTRRRLADEIETHQTTLRELQRSRDALEQRHLALERAQDDQRELTEFIVHDLKNPLTVVNASLEFARERLGPAPSDLAEIITDASDAALRLRAMIEDLLTISRMEQATFPLQREAVSLTKLLRTVIQSFVRRAHEQGIILAPPPEVNLEIRADRTLLQRVLENVLDNAFRYTPARGRIAVTVQAKLGVEINVSNDGPVIPEQDRLRIFEKFRRGVSDGTSSGNAGLGLYFCKRAVEAHGGGIDVVETKDWPTSFRISLPA